MTEESPRPLRRNMFVKRSPLPKLSSDRARRESLITHHACALLGGPQAVGFLNGNNEMLGGRPLDIATASASGYAEVELAIRLLAQPVTGGRQ